MKHSHLWLALCLLGAMASNAKGQEITWAKDYPDEGTVAGSIKIKGNLKIGNWKLPDNPKVTAVTWKAGASGGVAKYTDFKINGAGDWGEFQVEGLTAGTTYNIIVITYLLEDVTPRILLSAPRVQKAKP